MRITANSTYLLNKRMNSIFLNVVNTRIFDANKESCHIDAMETIWPLADTLKQIENQGWSCRGRLMPWTRTKVEW
jgi:hypothetical protein